MILSHKFFLLIFVPLACIPLLTDAQIIKRKSKSDFKAPVIYTLQTSSDTSINAAFISKTDADKDSNQVKKDSGQEAILKLLSAIQKDVNSIKTNQLSGDDRTRTKNYSNFDTIAMSEGYDHQREENIRAIPDSVEKPYKTDSLKRDDAYKRKLDSLEKRIDMLQKKKPQTDTLIINKRELIPDSLKQPTANRYNDSLAAINTRDSLTNTRKMDSLTKIEYDIKSNNDTMAVIQQSLKEAKDSANYYRRLAFASSPDNEINLDADTKVKVDSNQKKRNWFQQTFNRKNDKEKRDEKINIKDSSSANPDQNKLDQNSNEETDENYDERVRSIDQQLKDLQGKNEMLGRNYDQLKLDMQMQENQNTQRLYNSRRYNNNNYDAEISSLRDEIKRVKDNAANDNRSRNYIPSPITFITPPAATHSRDTVYMAPAPIQADSSPSNENDEIMEELKALRNQMDSLKKSSLKPSNAIQPEPRDAFEPASYPITSLYFKMGAASFGKDQDNKMVPFATVAKKNPAAIVSLTAFTDPVGNPTVNNRLANARLHFVQQMLVVKYHIDASRIILEESVLGKGANKPNPMDRRVDIQFQ